VRTFGVVVSDPTRNPELCCWLQPRGSGGAALAQHNEAIGRGADAIVAMRQAEVAVKALEHAGYEIKRRS
jgi:hypothetical protein